jgi:hypothetical protein
VRKGKKEIPSIRKSSAEVTNLTSGAKILLRKKTIQVMITRSVMISAVFSGRLHQLIPHDSYQRILWERRKIGVNTRPIWKTNVVTVIGHLILQFLLPNGTTQWRIDLRAATPLMDGNTTFSFFAIR